MVFPRSSGILLHPTSFPSRFGIGDVGDTAYHFIDFLEAGKQGLWQVLPLGPTGYGNSPYTSHSSMAGNPLLISLERLVAKGVLSEADLEAHSPTFPKNRVDYEHVIPFKLQLLTQAAQQFRKSAIAEQQTAFEIFCRDRHDWLEDYAFFMALKQAHDQRPWHQWEQAIAQRQPEAMDRWRHQLADPIFYQKYWQFEFFNQWQTLKTYANKRGISIIGDMPIYVAHDSADVWASPEFFQLDPHTGEAALMAGYPPGYFNRGGQLWGHPIYNWNRLVDDGFQWWIRRFKGLLEYVDIIRLDHFRGFDEYWAVPQGSVDARNGRWVKAPGELFFKAIATKMNSVPIIAEDMGGLTPAVEALRDQFGFPGLKFLQLAFGTNPRDPYHPSNYHENCVVYTGNHDFDTAVGWFNALQGRSRDNVFHTLGPITEDGIHWMLIQFALESVANQTLFPLQDVLGLGSDARMNHPGVSDGNWAWRYNPAMLTQKLSDRLAHLTGLAGRDRAVDRA